MVRRFMGGGSSACHFGCGTVFKLTPRGSVYTETIIHRFQGGSDGTTPYAGLIADKSGALYGTAAFGGSGCKPGCGIVFKLSPAMSSNSQAARAYAESIIYAFRGGDDGAIPLASLLLDEGGSLYGTTNTGGGTACNFGAGCGTAFKLTQAASGYAESILHRFSLPSDSGDGWYPQASLITDNRGALYGTTSEGGDSNNRGVRDRFQTDPNCVGVHRKHSPRVSGNADGVYPYAGLVAEARGTLDGTTSAGGGRGCPIIGHDPRAGCGVVFRLNL